MCVFCRIVEGSIPSYKVYEDDDVLAILDISQATIGHTLVMPKIHVSNILESSDELNQKLFKVVGILSKRISENLNCEGINIVSNNKQLAGQTVDHLHIHIIPRYIDDDFSIIYPSNSLTKEQFLELLDKING